MSPTNPPYGLPNLYAAHVEAERACVNPTPYTSAPGPPHTPSSYPYQPAVPPRRAPSGRLTNRHNGTTTHQGAAAYPLVHGNVHGAMHAFSSPEHNMPQQSNLPSQYLQPHIPPAQPPTLAPSPLSSNQRIEAQFPNTHFSSVSSLYDALPQQTPSQLSAPPSRPNFLIIGLFALRLTKHLIQQLDPYPSRTSDIAWLDTFLQPYHAGYALAKLKEPRVVEEYVSEYPRIVRSMIKQSHYRRVFMDMNPDKKVVHRDLGDEELRAIIDFADAAGEWGSVVPLPGKYAERMEKLANERWMAE